MNLMWFIYAASVVPAIGWWFSLIGVIALLMSGAGIMSIVTGKQIGRAHV